jgi:hypothetical protein
LRRLTIEVPRQIFSGPAFAKRFAAKTIATRLYFNPELLLMNSNIADEQNFEGNSQLPEPHFDEEATLLSARPVVPLDRVKPERRNGRRMSFGIAIISSLVLGALAAKLIYRSGNEGKSPAIVGDASRDGSALINQAAPTASLKAEAAGGSTEVSQNATAAGSQSTPGTSIKQELKKEVSRRKSALSQAEREARLEKRFENDQEQERERRKEARRHQSRPADGLLRIREIFEGPARP